MTATTTLRTTTVEPAWPAHCPLPPVDVAPAHTDSAGWADYVAAAPGATVFHQPAWAHVVADVFHHRPLHLLARRGARVVGVLPLMEVNSLLGGRLHVSVPYGTYGGILAEDADATGALAACAVQLAQERRARVLDLRSADAVVPAFESVTGYVGFARDLPERVEDVAATLPKRARAAARHARDRDHVMVRHGPALLETVYGLYCRSMRRIGSINYPRRFFARLLELFDRQAWVSVAYLGERPVAGTLCLISRDTIMPYVLGADERVRCDGAANWLYWSIMERAVVTGLRRFDYGRSRADNAGAVGFKKNQGFDPCPLGYQRYVPPGRTAPDLSAGSPRFERARRIWQRLPLTLTRTAGAWLARSLPG